MEKFVFTLSRSTTKGKNTLKQNQMLSANDRLHHHVKAKITRYLRQLPQTQEWSTPMYDKDNPCIVRIDVRPPTRRRMDAPNWYPTVKALIDGFVDAGLLADDNNHIITETQFLSTGVSGHKNYELEITFINVPINKFKREISDFVNELPINRYRSPYYQITIYDNDLRIKQEVSFDQIGFENLLNHSIPTLSISEWNVECMSNQQKKLIYNLQTDDPQIEVLLEVGDSHA